ncbi:TRAP transporter substrate-binding protein [Caldimonas thermodepolymerans]|jgi:TRAP-type C4-dicarboxylate transport system, periplasmic component|uniref:C4-dicarboxylate ABC transporter substrate-binding protein n=1 Tax=Caldimonas thermodepolymerans TaxID=215580 RepID=A0A2S5T4X7_9BURK|nr:TRAP transporter substrate-binding protein [Caldimonas thermodepolymerans]PPE70006.1 C4-dicarboxylate ABC transporter substrate-binding protein [Caldimonas thermodepolymerans]QPC31747.1 TRAP transporter substrate-binding protein [Caldimonas thermodepolymerans]RDI01750.1 TRAP-type C4-dicarboxylate transport system substrate-binding protein [Caldimonas thermodepolymerans]TCP05887.1 TRAP-type C4-dicarboxylate transport system substrate-binding protein [Caldimonas thermodepolymerans]UZG48175.1 
MDRRPEVDGAGRMPVPARRCSRRAWLQALAAAAIAAGRGPVRAASADRVRTWQLATGYPAHGFHARNIERFAQDVQAATGGALRIDVHAGGQLAPLPEILDGLRAGRFEAGEVLLSGSAAQLPLADVDAVPFVVSGYEDARRLAGISRAFIDQDARALGLRLLFDVPWPPQGLYARRPVGSIADLRGMRFRVYNETTRRFAAYVQAQPVEIGAVELPEAIRTGRIDAMLTSAATGVDSEAWNGLRHFYDIHAWIPKNAVLVRLAAFDALPPEHQGRVLDAAAVAQQRGWQMSQDEAGAARQALAARGMTVEPPGAILARELKRLGEKFSLEWIRGTAGRGNAVFLPYFTQAASR